jgi:hypothetical protein
MTDRPHLWVPYPYAPGDAEICMLCGEFQTPENAAGGCPETLMDELAPVPLDMPGMLPDLDPADGADNEMRAGAIIPP